MSSEKEKKYLRLCCPECDSENVHPLYATNMSCNECGYAGNEEMFIDFNGNELPEEFFKNAKRGAINEKLYSICSEHQVEDPDCPRCKVKFPEYIHDGETITCSGCNFVYFDTVDICPKCNKYKDD